MFSQSHQVVANVSADKLLDLKQWHKIQDLFAEIIGANLNLINPQGKSLAPSSRVSPSCFDLEHPKAGPSFSLTDCERGALRFWSSRKGDTYRCPHGLSFFTLPIRHARETVALITVGPLVVGKRESERACRILCRKQGIHFNPFMDRVREIRLFSQNGIRVVIDFLRELTEHLVRLTYQRGEFERLVPGFLTAQKEGQNFFSATYSNLLTQYLLEIASQVVQADSGSVLLLDSEEKGFWIKSALGIRPEVLKKRHVPLRTSVAGLVVARRKPMLISSKTANGIPKTKLKRPHIKSSMVVPLEFEKRILGVFCLNAKSQNKRFNPNNLVLLDQLGKLAGVALSRVSAN